MNPIGDEEIEEAKGLTEREGLPGHILLVEDDEHTLKAFTYVLRSLGYLVTPVAKGAEAVRLVQDRSFDLVITDLRMPEVHGIEVIRSVREKKPELPVVVITAHSSVNAAVRAMREGAVDYLVKPLSIETMRHRIGRILQGGGPIPFPELKDRLTKRLPM